MFPPKKSPFTSAKTATLEHRGFHSPPKRTMNWQTYLTDEFPSQLAAYAAEHPDTSTCVDHPHCCQAPQERRVLFERGQVLSLKADFACAWYGLTLLEQGLFRDFPEQLEPWLQEHPGLKLPVTWAGMGCVRVMTPQGSFRTPTKTANKKPISDQASARICESTVCSAVLAALIPALSGRIEKICDFLPGTGAEWVKLHREIKDKLPGLHYCETDDNAKVFALLTAQIGSSENLHLAGARLTESFERLLDATLTHPSLFVADLVRLRQSAKEFSIKQKSGSVLEFMTTRLYSDAGDRQESLIEAPACLILIPSDEEIAPENAPDILVSVPYDGEHDYNSPVGHYLYIRLPKDLREAAGIEDGFSLFVDTRGIMACIPETWDKLRDDFAKLLNGESAETARAESIPHVELELRKSGRKLKSPHSIPEALDQLNASIEGLTKTLSETKKLALALS